MCGILSCGAANGAMASELYIGGAGTILALDGYSQNTTAGLVAIRGNAGIDLTRYFGLEGHFGFGVIDDHPSNGPIKVEIDKYLAGYGRLIWPVSENGRLFALLGVAQSSIKATTKGVSSRDDNSDLSYGLGGEIAVTDALRVGVDMIVLSTKGDTKIWSLAAGARWGF
jgi:hypothetical protein